MAGDAFVDFTVDASHIGEYIEEKKDAIVLALEAKVDAIDHDLQALIAGEKLQGEVLQSHTNTLAGSVQALPVENDGNFITGTVQAGGGPAFYGIFQNYGTAGPYEIVAQGGQALAFRIGGQLIFRRSVMHPGLPARNFMESTLDESRAAIYAALQQTSAEAASE